MRNTSWIAVGLLSLALMGAAPEPQDGPELRELFVTVGAHSVRALCTDGPTRALVLHGAHGGADAWVPVMERLAGRVGVCAYDRPGHGGSAPAPETRGWLELEDELRQIHVALGVRPGSVLVGHGLGGLYARLFTLDRPGDVGGLVLVEPAHEDLPEAARPGMPSDVHAAWMLRRAQPNGDGVREAELAPRDRRDRLGNIPVTIITATSRARGDGYDERFLNQAARRVHASILRGVAAGRHIPAARSGPDVHLDEPGLVADEVSRVLRAVGRAKR